MAVITLEHFSRAATDIARNGDNDMLPFDVDTRFVANCQVELAAMAFDFFAEIEKGGQKKAKDSLDQLTIFSERLLAPTGAAGFRISTKIHPFWNLYFNAIGVGLAEANEPQRSSRAHAYRFKADGDEIFDRASSWRSFRECTIKECEMAPDDCIVVQADISSFYEHLYHHRIENYVRDLFPSPSTVPTQVERLLTKFSAGRSFGLPVGSQCSRILAEVVMSGVDRALESRGILAHRYVDDFVLIARNSNEAYKALAELSHALADYGLTLNRTKTIFLTAKHYVDYVRMQLGGAGDQANKLREIDLHYDPYSDRAEEDYDELRATIDALEIRKLLDAELRKAQPDAFMVTQIGRTLGHHEPEVALQLCATLLLPANLHAFRASWSTIMRGVGKVRAKEAFADMHDQLDILIDAVQRHSAHLLVSDASLLHYLRLLRFKRTVSRSAFVMATFVASSSQTVRRACVECWRTWVDREAFLSAINRWNEVKSEEARMIYLAAGSFGDDGAHFRLRVEKSLARAWALGIERQNRPTFDSSFVKWVKRES